MKTMSKPMYLSAVIGILWLLIFIKLLANPVYENSLDKFSSDPSPENIKLLGGHLRGIAQYNSDIQINAYYLRIQNALVSTPGHAQYFADEIEKMREEVQSIPPGSRGSYNSLRANYIIKTLVHLPSPETIWVLGEMLYDDRDPPLTRTWRPDNASYAAFALSNVGLRDPTFREVPISFQLSVVAEEFPDAPTIEEFQSWWKEVKSGTRTFSFKGQAVEYRFNPDGTWETLPIANPPDDAPRPPSAPEIVPDAASPPVSPVVHADESPHRPRRWLWLGLPVLLLAGWLAFLRGRQKNGR